MKTETRKVAELKPHPSNYRSHPDAQLVHLRASLREHGFQKPVVIQPDGTILAGHGLVEAAKAASIWEVPVKVYDGPDPEKYLVADNETARLAEDDEAALARLIAEMDDLEGTGIGEDDAEALARVISNEPPDVDFPEYDENIDLSGIKQATCPECGHEFPL